MTELLAGACFLFALAVSALCWAQRDEIAFLRTSLTEKRDHAHRVERAQAGLPEIKAELPPHDAPPPGLQARIDQAIGAWGLGATQEQLQNDVRAYRREGREWQWIAEQLESELV